MKKNLIIFICIFALTSCFSSKNTENSKVISWSTSSGNISENSSETGSKNKEKPEEKILPTEYEIISEKSYFYTNSNDSKPRKVYVMKWDKITVDNQKSTENMIFARYTNSYWKTTEWFLKKSEISAIENNSQKSKEKTEKISKTKCVNIYDFAKIPADQIFSDIPNPTWKVRFQFGWDNDNCIQQKEIPLSINIIWTFENFYKKYSTEFVNWYVEHFTGGFYGCDWFEDIIKPKTIKINGKKIKLDGFKRYCEWSWTSYFVRTNIDEITLFIETTQNNIENDLKIISENFEKYLKIEELSFTKEDRKKLQKIKKEEIDHRNKENEKMKNEELKQISSVNWTSDLLQKSKFGNNGESIKLYYNDKDYFYISTWMNVEWWAIDLCNDPWASGSECIIDKVANGFVFWKSSFNHTTKHHSGGQNWNWYHEYYYGETQYKTNIKTENTEKIKEFTKTYCLDYNGENYPCE